jgi:undecaprenyl-diphosphatase
MKKNLIRYSILVFIIYLFFTPCPAEIPGGNNRPGIDVTEQERDAFSLIDTLVLGVVEGVTEYLPVSSTGHLLLAQHIMGMDSTQKGKDASNSYAIIIQIGAILAVLSLYRRRIGQIYQGLIGRNKDGLRLFFMLMLAFLPAAVIGLLFGDIIKSHLFGMWPIAFGWFVGGVAIFLRPKNKAMGATLTIEQMRWQNAIFIGIIQVAAMWPGISRSLATIFGGLIAGLGLSAALEFSFLLGLITLGAATSYEILDSGVKVFTAYGVMMPLVGILSSFIAAWVSVKWLISFLQKRGMNPFGYYRIVLALVTSGLLLAGIL